MVRFAFMRAATLSMRLLGGYLHQPYTWFLNRHSAELGANRAVRDRPVVANGDGPAMRLLANVVVVLFLIGLLVAVDPVVALFAGGLIVGSYGLIFVGAAQVHRPARQGAADRQRPALPHRRRGARRHQGRQAPRARGRLRRALPSVRRCAWRGAIASDMVIGETPRYVLEGIAFGGMLLLIIFMLVSGNGSLESILPLLGIYAFAGLGSSRRCSRCSVRLQACASTAPRSTSSTRLPRGAEATCPSGRPGRTRRRCR